MDLRFTTPCPNCNSVLTLKEKHFGKEVNCPSCRNSFEVHNFTRNDTSLELEFKATTVIESKCTNPSEAPPSRSPGEFECAEIGQRGSKLEKLGRFELKELLGEGGFGRVYRAYDPQLDRFVALKVPTFSVNDQLRVNRFIAEAKSAAQLRHPHIVPTFDSGKIGDKLYIAAQLVLGQSLSDRLKASRVSPKEGVIWMAKIADAVNYAHQQGIVHRDIKPHNVMLDEKQEPQLMDFGLAKRIDDDSNMTVDGARNGHTGVHVTRAGSR